VQLLMSAAARGIRVGCAWMLRLQLVWRPAATGCVCSAARPCWTRTTARCLCALSAGQLWQGLRHKCWQSMFGLQLLSAASAYAKAVRVRHGAGSMLLAGAGGGGAVRRRTRGIVCLHSTVMFGNSHKACMWQTLGSHEELAGSSIFEQSTVCVEV
jgi:hypothetical protein